MIARFLATISRSYREWSTVRGALVRVYQEHPGWLLDHGDCEDGDQQVAGIWRQLGGAVEPHPADWPTCAPDCPPGHRKVRKRTGEEFCPSAGFRRNIGMVELAPLLVLAFLDPESKTKGAYHCAQIAEDAGITVVRYVQGSES